MNYKDIPGEGAGSSARLWRSADYEFDELARELRVKGAAVELESKPMDVLLQLLLHAGEVVTKEELLESVWPDVTVVDGSLATAVSKLRKAMGDEEHPAVVTVPRVGYRLAIPVYCRTVAAAAGPELGFKAGDAVPGREQRRLSRAMDISGSSEVWLAENPKTHGVVVSVRDANFNLPQHRHNLLWFVPLHRHDRFSSKWILSHPTWYKNRRSRHSPPRRPKH